MRRICILTCSGPARRIREVRSRDRNSAASNRPQSSAPRKRRPQIRGRTCRDRSSRADTGTPAGRPDCTARPASRPCSNTCRRHRRRGRCSSGRSSRLKVEREKANRARVQIRNRRVFYASARPAVPSLRAKLPARRISASPTHPVSYQSPIPIYPRPSRPGAADCVHGVDEWTNFLNYGIGTIALFPQIPPAPGKL